MSFFFLETAQAEGVTTTEAGVGAESYKRGEQSGSTKER